MTTLPTKLRIRLEKIVIEERDVAEAGAKLALEALAVNHYEPYPHMSPEERGLRNHLRARSRNLGDRTDPKRGAQEIGHLVLECAYEHWHRMLFARFLAVNQLLIEPEMGVAITLDECEELAREKSTDLWTLAGRYAQKMLPQIFRPDDPILKIAFAPEGKARLEELLDSLPREVFTASDSLGWVYQFWQSKRKKQVNESGVKIGADELPAVTQLFTEPYMVSFLLDNSLGAWRAARVLDAMSDEALAKADEAALRKACSLPGVPLEYLRFVKDDKGQWQPAAGRFDAWPEHLSELKVMDPCCGSGHFLVAAFLMLVPIRVEMEGLSAQEAVDSVIQENLHGLEIDQRCVELAAFALALVAWRFPGAGGYRSLPELKVACSGLAVSVAKEEWKQLGLGKRNLTIALDWMYDVFKDAPVLGSLINPAKTDAAKIVQWEELSITLEEALKQEQTEEQQEATVVAQGLAKAAMLLAGQYSWVITNVPYLARGKQSEKLRDFCEKHFTAAKSDLATVFLERCLELCVEGGTSSIVLPQNWLFLTSYKKLREKLLRNESWQLIARLGPGAFETISGEVVKAILITLNRSNASRQNGELFGDADAANLIRGVDVSNQRTALEKAIQLLDVKVKSVEQASQLDNPDVVVSLEAQEVGDRLGKYARSLAGLVNGDTLQFRFVFYEMPRLQNGWVYQINATKRTSLFDGREHILRWENGQGNLVNCPGARLSNIELWGSNGIYVSRMNHLPSTLCLGTSWDRNGAMIVPRDDKHLGPIWACCSSENFPKEVRRLNQKLSVSEATFENIPFDLEHWTKIAEEKYPNGLPKPYSDDPTQWIFHGHPCGSVIWDNESKWTASGPLRTDSTALQIAVARLLGYRWPAELDPDMELSDEARELVRRCDELLHYADNDGIVCIPSIRGEDAAEGRLRALLVAAYGPEWSPAKEKELIAATGSNAPDFDGWLRNDFFEQHCKLFQHRPFIWHVWDGRSRDGFHSLVNYHKVAAVKGKSTQLLQSLTYSYLGEWINRQKDGIRQGLGGAEDRLAAAQELQKHLEAIMEGEHPFDIFVRWKPIEEQPVGWEPDINDGVRLNIRPFMTGDIPGGREGAGILRWKPNIHWKKDRGKDVEFAPWFHKFEGDRINEHHLTIEEKQRARAEKGK